MMKRMIQRMMAAIFTLCSLMTVSAALTSCSSDDGNAKESEIALEDALKEGNIVTLSFNMNGEDYEIAFPRHNSRLSASLASPTPISSASARFRVPTS